MTQFEATQLKKIDDTAISSDQWGYVGGMDQHVATASDVVFEKLSLTETSKTWSFDPIGSSGTNTLSGDLQITTANTEDASIIIGGSSYDDHTVRNYAYTSGMFTGDGWSIYEDNNYIVWRLTIFKFVVHYLSMNYLYNRLGLLMVLYL
jgi:hypothetical protein